MNRIRIAIVGDFNPAFQSHHATNACFKHAEPAMGCAVESSWVPTTHVEQPGPGRALDGFDGLWISSGSPYRSMAGAIEAIRYARTRGRPLYAT
ncbi:MAG: hypothetical protein ACREUU_15255 [Gammaproteobacteria bacterium]